MYCPGHRQASVNILLYCVVLGIIKGEIATLTDKVIGLQGVDILYWRGCRPSPAPLPTPRWLRACRQMNPGTPERRILALVVAFFQTRVSFEALRMHSSKRKRKMINTRHDQANLHRFFGPPSEAVNVECQWQEESSTVVSPPLVPALQLDHVSAATSDAQDSISVVAGAHPVRESAENPLSVSAAGVQDLQSNDGSSATPTTSQESNLLDISNFRDNNQNVDDATKYQLVNQRIPPAGYKFPPKHYKDKRKRGGFMNRYCQREWFDVFKFIFIQN